MNPPAQRATSIEDLPPEMISEVFKRLKLKHLVTCSLVNKRWHSIYTSYKLQRLAVADESRYDNYFVKWSHSNRTIREEERCRPAAFVGLVEHPLLSSLKHLVLAGAFEFNLNKLNAFDQLVHLEIKMPILSEVHLKLPRLKVLAYHFFNNLSPLSIDCSQLSVLAYVGEDANLLKVKNPETIRKLVTSMVGSKLAPFQSVECLVTKEFDAISQTTLLSLPALKELRYNGNIERLFRAFNNAIGTLDRVRRTLREFLDHARVLRRGTDFRFCFSGFPLTKETLEQIDFGAQIYEIYDEDEESDGEDLSDEEHVSNEYVYLKNQQLIDPNDPLEFLIELNYTRLINCATGGIPSDFCEKLICVQSVSARRLHSADHLLWFLALLRSLRKLNLNCVLGQQFFDDLPASAPSLTRLVLIDRWASELRLNFDFIANFSNILRIEIENQLSFDSFKSLAKHFGQLEWVSIRFSLNRLKFSICTCNNIWIVKQGDRCLFETERPHEILSFFEGQASY